ncbi:hypothetical protein BT93_L4407 [Corymbia citriodora subsp. variegata]|uniref:Chromosome segregation in meiosis protein 3 domain-containing protein n=1 Tax=Corymbia citriodora subsp. variegata TaxID=360336 RepID=A0A8T0CFW1_CORYI|nr:hypothetical protein BT93_L4407 [Corymbia citriodora subsp. variegata]
MKDGSKGFAKKLRLKGKGHEFTDCARLLNYYQIWLDNLYPRAKFADALQLVEKAGHSKLMQVHRKSWLDEGKPGYRRAQQDPDETVTGQAVADQTSQAVVQRVEENSDALFFDSGNFDDSDHEVADDPPDDDELDALLAQNSQSMDKQQNKSQTEPAAQSEDEDDDLAAFLAEETARQRRAKQKGPEPAIRADALPEEDGDELDALLDMENEASTAAVRADTVMASNSVSFERTVSEDEPELPDVSQQQHTITKHTEDQLPGSEEVPALDSFVSSSPIPNVTTDELDDLLDQHDRAILHTQQSPSKEALEEDFISSSPIED